MTAVTAAPYKRIIVMHLIVIIGGWIVLALGTPAPALIVLIALKLFVHARTHRREHGITSRALSPSPPTASSKR